MTEIEIEKLEVSPQNVRKEVVEDKDGLGIDELAESIRELGVLQPIIVRPKKGDRYEVVVGQRRFLACKKLGLKKIPAIIEEVDDRTAIKQSVVENIHSSDISPLEKARTFKELCKGRTQNEVAKELGVSPSTISNYLCLLGLAPELQAQANKTDRTSHVQTLRKIARNFKDPNDQLRVTRRVEDFSQKEALFILKEADGDVNKVEEIAQEVAMRDFLPGFSICTGLKKCPFLPQNVREELCAKYQT